MNILTLYFSGTGNTKYIAELFSRKMNAKCLSIETDASFAEEIKAYDHIAFCYPVYCSRVPRIMREFVHQYMDSIVGKKIIIFATQMAFSGDGARVFSDMFEADAIDIIYAEHFNMPLNTGNVIILDPIWKPNHKRIQKCIKNVEAKMNLVCSNIRNNIIKKRGFALGSKLLGYIQGKHWQKDTKLATPQRLEKRGMKSVRIHKNCTSCNICIKICPMKNLVNHEGQIRHQDNCTSCYRCVNRCPKKAITVLIHSQPRWQYDGLDKFLC